MSSSAVPNFWSSLLNYGPFPLKVYVTVKKCFDAHRASLIVPG